MGRNIIIFGVILIVLIGIAYLSFSNIQSLNGRKTVDLKGNKIQLEVSDSETEHQKGLSSRDNLAKDRGMLFTFAKPDLYSFWMKEMRFPIDIIFINNDKIVTIYENVQPENDKNANLSLYTSTKPADKVIEINAGLAKEFGLKTGETLRLPN